MRLRTCFFYLTFYPFTLLCSIICLLISLFRGADGLHRFARIWGKGCLWLGGVTLTVEGTEHLPQDRPVVYMANHQGNFDIPTLFAGIPGQFRWLAKAELFRFPFFGHAMRRAGYIPVERNDPRKAVASIAEAAQRVAEGASVVLFPEGTRSPDGRLQPFKKGGFSLAMQAGAEIVPVAIDGSAAIMPKHTLMIRGNHIRLRISPPIPTAGLKGAEREQLMATVFQQIAAGITPPDSPPSGP